MLKLYRALHKNTRDSSRDAEAERAQYGNALKELVHTTLPNLDLLDSVAGSY